uniref:Methyltransferase n=1 Tax=viral metagenome TaxID=1070528 RepID=A0A6C0H693_9ZZZZ
MNLSEYLITHNITFYEGHVQQISEQIELLNELSFNSEKILEIGFGMGHSSEVFLSSHPNRIVVSFDDGNYIGYSVGKGFIDLNYPLRHTLILGDSKKTLPNYINKINTTFDLIFIDGGHSYETSKSDLLNCKKLANNNTIVVMDDIILNEDWKQDWTIFPTTVWYESIKLGIIKELGIIEFEKGRGMAWGHYIF